jgi:hypothetical protein
MLFRSPLGRLLSLLFTAGIAAILWFAVIKDKVDEAKNNSPSGDPTKAGQESLFKQANFTKALAALRSKENGDAQMLEVQVIPGQASFQVKKGQKATGYRYDAKSGDTQQVKVEIVGGGSLEGSQYSLRRVSPDVTERLDKAVRKHNGLRPTTMTLQRGPVGTKLIWTVNAEGNGRTGLVFDANPDGSGLAEPTAFNRGSSGAPGAPALDKARKQQQCIVKAGSDAQQIQACLK